MEREVSLPAVSASVALARALINGIRRCWSSTIERPPRDADARSGPDRPFSFAAVARDNRADPSARLIRRLRRARASHAHPRPHRGQARPTPGIAISDRHAIDELEPSFTGSGTSRLAAAPSYCGRLEYRSGHELRWCCFDSLLACRLLALARGAMIGEHPPALGFGKAERKGSAVVEQQIELSARSFSASALSSRSCGWCWPVLGAIV
jgi:hypothetical protein